MIRLELQSPGEAQDYIRHVRRETLRSIRVEPSEALVRPLAAGIYTLAIDSAHGCPVGLSECYFHHDLASGYSDLPYSGVADLAGICPFHLMSGMRTVFVEPGHRGRNHLFLYFCVAAAYVFRTMGARFATATTDAGNEDLADLYGKLGGARLGTFRIDGAGPQEFALYVFDLDALASHRVLDRVRRIMPLDFHKLFLARRAANAGDPAVFPPAPPVPHPAATAMRATLAVARDSSPIC